MHGGKVGQGDGAGGGPGRKQALFQGGLVQGLDGGPVQAGLCGSRHVLGDDALGDAQGLGALALGMAQAKRVMKDGFDHARTQ